MKLFKSYLLALVVIMPLFTGCLGGVSGLPSFTLAVQVLGEGEVVISDSKTSYQEGSVVTLTAIPAAGWTFVEWQGDASGTDIPKQIVMDSDKEISAIFVQTEVDVTIVEPYNGVVTISPDREQYYIGDTIELSAQADDGWRFSHWNNGEEVTQNPWQIELTENIAVEAVFAELPVASNSDELVKLLSTSTTIYLESSIFDLTSLDLELAGTVTLLPAEGATPSLKLNIDQSLLEELVIDPSIDCKIIVTDDIDNVDLSLQYNAIFENTTSINNSTVNLNGNDVIANGDLIVRNSTLSLGNISRLHVENNLVLIGDGTLDVLDGEVVVDGNLNQNSDGFYDNLLVLGRGLITIVGDYNLAVAANGGQRAILDMSEEAGILRVNGNFTINSSIGHDGRLTAGILEIGGDFKQETATSFSSPLDNFAPSGSHTVVLNGIEQQAIFFQNANSSYFNNLELRNVTGMNIQQRARVVGELNDLVGAAGATTGDIILSRTATITNGEWLGDLLIHFEQWELQHDVSIHGNLRLTWSGDVVLSGSELKIGGDLTIEGSKLDASGSILNVNGSLYKESQSSSSPAVLVLGNGYVEVAGEYRMARNTSLSAAILEMTDPGGVLKVLGDFYTYSTISHSDRLTAGRLEIGGDFTRRQRLQNQGSFSNFQALNDHIVVFNGDQQQQLHFGATEQSHFNDLTISNSSGVRLHQDLLVKRNLYIPLDGVLIKNGNDLTVDGELLVDGTIED